ncbi:hypothetical protein CWI38_0860p0010, partial [Hamiltosporidium tvaerminnensis]
MYFHKFLSKNNYILISGDEKNQKTPEKVSKLSKNCLKKCSTSNTQAGSSSSNPKCKKIDFKKTETKIQSLPMRTPGNLSCSYQCEDERNLDLSTPKSNTIHASDKIHTDIDLARCLKTSNVVELDLVLKNIREYRLNEIYQDISIIFKYNVLFCDAYNTMAVNTFFAILDKLLEMEKSIMNANHFKTIEYKQLFKEKIKGIDISTSRSAILSKVPVHNMLKKHVDIKKNIKGFTSKLFVSIFFALE